MAIVATVSIGSAIVSAQWLDYPTANVPRTTDGKPDMTARTPRTAGGKPDFSGMWGWETRANCGAHCNDFQISREFMNIAANLKTPLPYKPGVEDLVKQRTAAQDQDPNVHCMPRGAARIWTDDYFKRIVQAPDRVIVLTERNMQYRQIFTDGRPLPKDPNPTWNGYSTAKWDGDTLVVDSRGFNGRVWLDQLGKPSTEALHVTTRFTRKDFGHMDIGVTIDDPKAYTKPWGNTVSVTLVPDTDLMEFICLENEKDTKRK
jgi:hypothetical protein